MTSILVFLLNVQKTARSKQDVPANPWDGATLEWAIPSPPPVYNFRITPVVTHRDQLWHDKYDLVPAQREAVADAIVEIDQLPVNSPVGVAIAEAQAEVGHIHLPNPSYYPLLCALGLLFLASGFLLNNPHIQITEFIGLPILSALGLLILITSIYGWSFEPAG